MVGLALPSPRSACPPRTVIRINIPSSPFLGSYSASKSAPPPWIRLPLPLLLMCSGLGEGRPALLPLAFLIWKSEQRGPRDETIPWKGAGPAVHAAPSLGRAQPCALLAS